MTARIAPGGGPAVRAVARVFGRVSGTTPPAVFTTLGRHPRVFWPWLGFAGALLGGGRLTRAQTELVILRVAVLNDSAYELVQHRRVARKAGLTAADVERVSSGPEVDGWTPEQRVLLRAVDALQTDEDLDDPTWRALVDAFDEQRAIEVVLLAGHYRMLATALRTLRVPPDAPRR